MTYCEYNVPNRHDHHNVPPTQLHITYHDDAKPSTSNVPCPPSYCPTTPILSPPLCLYIQFKEYIVIIYHSYEGYVSMSMLIVRSCCGSYHNHLLVQNVM